MAAVVGIFQSCFDARFVGDFVRRIVSNAMIGTAKRPDSLRLARYGGIKKFEEPDWLFEFDSF